MVRSIITVWMTKVLLVLTVGCLVAAAAPVAINSDGVLTVNGKPVFPIGFTLAPPPWGKTPAGGDAYAELKSNGTVFHRCGPARGQWGAPAEAALDHLLDRSARSGLLAAISIPDRSGSPRRPAAPSRVSRRRMPPMVLKLETRCK